LPSCSWHYIGKRKFTSDPSVGLGFTCTPMVLVGLLLGDLAHMNMSCPNNSPSSTRLWSVLHDLVDAHTRRGTIQLEPWLRGLPFANHMCSLAKNSIPKTLWEKRAWRKEHVHDSNLYMFSVLRHLSLSALFFRMSSPLGFGFFLHFYGMVRWLRLVHRPSSSSSSPISSRHEGLHL
jgi:hypothetical protein